MNGARAELMAALIATPGMSAIPLKIEDMMLAAPLTPSPPPASAAPSAASSSCRGRRA